MTGDTDAPAAGEPPTDRAGRRARRVAVVWTVVVVAASLIDPAALLEPVGAPAATGAGEGGGAGAFVIAHLVAYGVLTWLLVDGTGVRGPRAVVAAVAVAAVVGVGVELLQAPVAARTASAADTLLNTVGATVGAGLRAALHGSL